ncbi:MAG: TrkA family potassium uptake protein [Dehalococcoidia bacterium]|nr:TrkA family potassium uptake protein [Dehalococcoidia bacterium]
MSSFLVIGIGRFGSSLATELYQMKHSVMVVDANESSITSIVNHVTSAIIGDCKDETVLRSLDVPSFDCVVVSMASNIEDNILATMILKELGAKMLVCKAQNERHAKILTQLGADRVIRPEFDMGKRVAHSLVQGSITDQLEISPEYSIMEIITPQQWIGKSIEKIKLRAKYGISVIAIHHTEQEKIKLFPDPNSILSIGDALILIGAKHDLDTISGLK